MMFHRRLMEKISYSNEVKIQNTQECLEILVP